MSLEERLIGKSYAELLAMLDVLSSPIPDTIETILNERGPLEQEAREQLDQVKSWFREVREIHASGARIEGPYCDYRVKRKADTLRFRIIATVMGMVPQTAHDLIHQPEQVTLQYYNGNLAVGELDNYLTLLLPHLMGGRHIDDLISGLSESYEHYREARNWIVDFSSIGVIPKTVLGQLVSYRRQLRQKGRELYVCWLKSDALSVSELNLLTEHAKLKKIGQMYFSELAE